MTAAPDGAGLEMSGPEPARAEGREGAGGLGLVVIGRNEGDRLRRCLATIAGNGAPVVYVDSGSSDGSLDLARGFGAQVVVLDTSRPFTAARARNVGVGRLAALAPGLEFVQFIDGDCELDAGWLPLALAFLRDHPAAAVACGRRREQRPGASLYNRLCDAEWDTPVGEAEACGGDALIRLSAFREVGGFDPALIAGEEPDLCWRLRQRGWKVFRLDAEMTRHDANMVRFSQWWVRNVRSGHAMAEALDRRGGWRNRAAARPIVSNLLWALPALWPLWPLLWWRVWRTRRDAAHATFIVLGKLPHLQGQVRYWRRRGAAPRLIEYK